jgi:hypothetical protein
MSWDFSWGGDGVGLKEEADLGRTFGGCRKQGSEHFSYRGLDRKYLRFAGLQSLEQLVSSTTAAREHLHFVSKWVWLCSNKTLFIKSSHWAYLGSWTVVYQYLD